MSDPILRHRRSLSGEEGFTLIEVLVTLALMAMLTTIMSGAIGQLRNLSSASHRNDANVELEAILAYLDRMISSAQTLPLMAGSDRLLFTGTGNNLQFVAVARLGVRGQGLRDVSVSFIDEGDSKRLVQAVTPRRFDRGQAEQIQVVLAENLEAVTFEYRSWGRGKEPNSSWLGEWNAPGLLPSAIRVKVTATRFGKRIENSRIVFLPSSIGRQSG